MDQVFLLYLLTQEALVPSHQPYIMSRLDEPHEIYNRQRKSCTSHLSLMSEPYVNENQVARWWMGKVISVRARTHERGILFSHLVVVTCVHKICQRGLEEEGNNEPYLPSYIDSIKNSFVLKDEALRGGISRFKPDLLAERVEGRKTTGTSFVVKVTTRSRSVDLKDAARTTKSAETEMSFTTGVICTPKSMFESSRCCSATTKLL